jgi:pimeloyl-ACP methyl ester carboxylesterase
VREAAFLGLSAAGFHRVAYTEWGDSKAARVVVCCHGLTRNGRDFDLLAQRLSKTARVICPDVVGRGKSDWLADSKLYGYPQYVADMNALIARLDVAQVDWIGTSMGGLIGMLLAASAKSPIRSLVMNDVGPFVPKAALQRISDYVGLDNRFSSLASLENHLRKAYAPFGPLTDAQWAHLTAHGHRNIGDGTYGLSYDPGIATNVKFGVQDWDMWPLYDKVTTPTMIIRGMESDLLSESTAAEMAKRGPKAKRLDIPGVGHAPALMAEDQIDAMEKWLSSVA